MKNKLVVMFITFAILIALTPIIFSKLMNSRYDKMLDNLRNEGINIKVIETKNSYLTSDRILEVTIPDKILNTNGIVKNVTLNIETKFKNLPVTNVVFNGKVENIRLSNEYKEIEPQINEFVKKYIKFVVMTPNFKDYTYTLNDIKVDNKNVELAILGIKGMFQKNNIIKNNFTITDSYFKNQNLLFEIKNFKSNFEEANKNSYSKTNFNVNLKSNMFKAQINNVYTQTKTLIDKKIKLNSTIGFDSLDIVNIAKAKDFKFNFNTQGLDTKTIQNLSTSNKVDREKYINQIFEKGFKVEINSNIKNIKLQRKDIGGYDLSFNVNFKPTKNFEEKLQNNNLDFVDMKLKFTTTPEIATLIMNIYPKSAFVFMLAKKENGKVTLDLEYKDNKLYSEGQLIK